MWPVGASQVESSHPVAATYPTRGRCDPGADRRRSFNAEIAGLDADVYRKVREKTDPGLSLVLSRLERSHPCGCRSVLGRFRNDEEPNQRKKRSAGLNHRSALRLYAVPAIFLFPARPTALERDDVPVPGGFRMFLWNGSSPLEFSEAMVAMGSPALDALSTGAIMVLSRLRTSRSLDGIDRSKEA